MCDKHSWFDWQNCELHFGNNIWKKPVDYLKVLGSIISYDGTETAAIKHRISSAWKCFSKWQHILLATSHLSTKVVFWMKTVYRSLIWGLQTTRKNEYLTGLLSTCQKLMFRKMMRLKRRPIHDENGKHVGVEKWLDWQIRSMTKAGTEIVNNKVEMGKQIEHERQVWAGRVSRLGFDGSPHILKYVVSWRCKFWWETQRWYNSLGWDPIRHQFPFKPARWEDSLPINWRISFLNEGPMGHIL